MNRFALLMFSVVCAIPFSLLGTDPAVHSAPADPAPFNFDIRTESAVDLRRALLNEDAWTAKETVLKSLARAERDFRSASRFARIERSAIGTVEVIAGDEPRGRFLSFGATRARTEKLRDFIETNRELFGLRSGSAGNLKVTADYGNPAGNLSFVHLEQSFNGVPVFGGEIKAGFTRSNEIVRIISGIVPDSGDAPSQDFGDPKQFFAQSVDDRMVEAVQVYFPVTASSLRPAWRLLYDGPMMYYVIIDSATGQMLWRKSLTEEQTQPATFEVYGNTTSLNRTADSPAPSTPSCPAPTGCPPVPLIPRQQFTLIGNEPPYNFNNLGWIADGETRTIGNSIEAGIDRDGTQGIDPNGWANGGAARNFVFAYNPAPGNPPPGDDPLLPLFQQGSVTHAFYTANRWHDETYRLGFTEAARNFQTDNFGRGGLGNDSISVEVQDGSGTNSANFATPADGGRPRAQFFLWTGTTPARDGALDSQVVVHELTHGLTNRLHGNATGLTTNMSRGMGEGWSDFFALAMLSEPTDDICGTYGVGAYVSGSYFYGIRRFPTALKRCVGPNGLPFNPITFGYLNSSCNTLIGTTTTNPNSAYPRGQFGVTTCDQVHNMGEVWSLALWEVRANLIEAHGAVEGNRRVLQYVVDGMKLSPTGPNLLQSRDAVIAATAAVDPADVILVRRGFATRGMGASASIQNAGTGNNDTVVTEAFDELPNAVIGPGFAVSDSIGNNDGFFEPGERVIVTVPLVNNAGATLTGVTLAAPDLAINANYGDIPNGATVTQTFATRIPSSAPCGGSIAILFSISSNAGNSTATRTILTGRPTNSASFESSAAVTINAVGPSTPYGTTIDVSGLNGNNHRITLEINNLTHTFPGDIDMLLVGPSGQKFIPMSDIGGGDDVNAITFTLNDLAPTLLPPTQLSAGIYRPSDITTGDTFPSPAPTGPYFSPAPVGISTFGSGLGSTASGLNGTWTLYVNDDASGDGGSMSGWKLKFETYTCIVCRFCATATRADFDGDGRSDTSVFRPTEGLWYLDRSTSGFTAIKWGINGDQITPGDFDGDLRADFAVFRPNSDPAFPDFYILNSGLSNYTGFSWGLPGDDPVIGDYDGDGNDDIAVFRPSNRTYYVRLSSTGGLLTFSRIAFGNPVTGDFDGDGRADFASYFQFGWYVAPSNINYASVSFIPFGAQNDVPVPADYDGDSRDDLAVFRPSDRTWYIRKSTGGVDFVQFGLSSDIPVPGDYDGDGRNDIAVFRNGVWYIQRSTSGLLVTQFGLAGDVPIETGY